MLLYQYFILIFCIIPQTFNLRLPTLVAHVRAWVNSYGILVDKAALV
jgi:hypothetical protein